MKNAGDRPSAPTTGCRRNGVMANAVPERSNASLPQVAALETELSEAIDALERSYEENVPSSIEFWKLDIHRLRAELVLERRRADTGGNDQAHELPASEPTKTGGRSDV